MNGNVLGWVRDRYTGYGNVGADNPIYEPSGALGVGRGGGWNDGSRGLRCSDRGLNTPSGRGYGLGFRLLRGR